MPINTDLSKKKNNNKHKHKQKTNALLITSQPDILTEISNIVECIEYFSL